MPDYIRQTAILPTEGDWDHCHQRGCCETQGLSPRLAGAAEDAVALGLHSQNNVIGDKKRQCLLELFLFK